MPTNTPSPAEQLNDDINSLQTKITWMYDTVRLKNVLNEVEDIQTTFANLPSRLARARSGGYVFEKHLDNEVNQYPRIWNGLHGQISMQINQQTTILQSSMRQIEMKMSQLNTSRSNISYARSQVSSIQSDISMLESKANSAESTIKGMYNAFASEVRSMDGHLSSIEYMLTNLAEANFTLLPTESGVRAVKAVWCKDSKERPEDPDGVLYLTDQRLLFEQKEEIATKKILFITTAKEKVQALKWEVPVAMVDQVIASKTGFLKNEDHLEIRFKPGAPVSVAHLHTWWNGEEWVQFINRAKTRDYDRERTVPVDKAAEEKVKAAPAQCPSCGANVSQVVLRGQDSITCEYCGFVIRI